MQDVCARSARRAGALSGRARLQRERDRRSLGGAPRGARVPPWRRGDLLLRRRDALAAMGVAAARQPQVPAPGGAQRVLAALAIARI